MPLRRFWPLLPWRMVLAEVGGATAGGVLFTAGFSVALRNRSVGGDPALEMAMLMLAVLIGFSLGCSLGVALVGRLLGQGGSLVYALLFSCLSGIGVLLLMRRLNLWIGIPGLLAVMMAAEWVSAVLAYNLKARSLPPH